MRIDLDVAVTECGDVFIGSVSWGEFDNPPRSVRVQLRYWTEGRGDRDEVVVSKAELPGAPSGAGRFELPVPADGPMSYDGTLLRVRWAVELVFDLALRPDPDLSEPVTVLPRGGLALWAREHAPGPVIPPPA